MELDNVLRVPCPRCEQLQDDEYETLSERRSSAWVCDSCCKEFSVLLVECEHCAHENIEAALAASEHSRLEDMGCKSCGKRCLIREED